MHSWLDLVDGSEFLAGLFEDDVPSLHRVELHEIILHRDGPKLTLRFDLQEFPKTVPPQWRRAGYNTLQITLSMIGLRSIVLSGWATQVTGPLRIAPDDALGVRVHFDSSSMSLGAAAPYIHLDRVSPYVNKPHVLNNLDADNVR